MRTFYVQTLGCKVNQYESEQVAALLRSHGLVEADASHADLRVVNTCSVTTEAAGKSRQASRRMVRLPVLAVGGLTGAADQTAATCGVGPAQSSCDSTDHSHAPAAPSVGAAGDSGPARRPRVIVTGCWATSDREAAAALPGVDAVITHHGDVAAELERLLTLWRGEERAGRPGSDSDSPEGVESGHTSRPQRLERQAPADLPIEPIGPLVESPPKRLRNDGWIAEAGLPADSRTEESKAEPPEKVNLQIYALSVDPEPGNSKFFPGRAGTTRLPLLGERQTGRQRAFLKIQDGCDAHCTYCIIPRLRPGVWSKPVDDVVEEARRLVGAGHVEVVLTGIFLGAYGHATALRRRQGGEESGAALADLVAALCTRVRGLRRLRLSSLEPMDLGGRLLDVLRDQEAVVPHFHLPLQSGSDLLLRRMNRQYTRDDFLRMIDRVKEAFDRPALTTDVIVGFPGETEAAFGETLEVVARAGFIHVHAFPYSARPGTAAARWTREVVRGGVVNERIEVLGRRAAEHSFAFRRRFVGEVVEVLVERDGRGEGIAGRRRHGRCERYFDVEFESADAVAGDFVRVCVENVSRNLTGGRLVSGNLAGGVMG